MHVLCGVRRNRLERRVPELRREFYGSSNTPGTYATETSGFDEAGGESWRMSDSGELS
jgi:hypothetical protein